MKWKTLLSAAARLFTGRLSPPDTDPIDGGVRHREDEGLPKKIRSERITAFRCRFSALDLSLEDTPIAGQIFSLTATKERCACQIRSRDRQITCQTFVPEPDFLARLQDIVTRYDMARENGRHYHVSGLPPDFGIDLEVEYASGERIRTTNNQSCFLTINAMEALAALFRQK